MNVDKWIRCYQSLLINEPDAVIVLYWASDVIIYCTSWVLNRAPRTKETLSDFVKFWILVNGTQRCGIELHDTHRHFTG